MASKILGLLAVGLLVGPMAAQAVTIWDESVNGDLSSATSSPTSLGSLGGGTWDLFGSLDAGLLGNASDGSDEFDAIAFSALGNWAFDATAVSLVGTTSLLVVLQDSFGGFIQAVFRNGPQNNIFGSRAAGTYRVVFVPAQNGGQVDYSVRFNVAAVPEPGTLALLGLGLLGLGMSRRRA